MYNFADTSAAPGSSDVVIERSVAVRAIAAELLQMLLPALLKLSITAVSSGLQGDKVSNRLAVTDLTACTQLAT